MNPHQTAVDWLLASRDPSIRYLTRVDVLGQSARAAAARADRAAVLNGPRVRTLLAGQKRDGGFGVHPYQKWTGAHWRLVALVELGLPAGEPRALQALETVLAWLTGEAHRREIRTIHGRTRRCASQEGNALAVCCRLGRARDRRAQYLAESLLEWQWPDGGWNCDKNPEAAHSSFYESLIPLWGLSEYHRATGEAAARRGAERAAEFFLRHRLFRSDRTGAVINPEWLNLHYPLYWHYDVLQALLVLSRLGPLTDPRLGDALDLVEAKRQPDGRWKTSGYYYWRRREPKRGLHVDVVDWGRGGPNEMVTLNALRVLKAAGRYS
jgi:hypothetical protein